MTQLESRPVSHDHTSAPTTIDTHAEISLRQTERLIGQLQARIAALEELRDDHSLFLDRCDDDESAMRFMKDSLHTARMIEKAKQELAHVLEEQQGQV